MDEQKHADLTIEASTRTGPYEGICRRCGFDEHCGCPADTHTMSLMSCPSCGGKWWRAWGDESTTCLHRHCGQPGSVVEREPKYPPNEEVVVSG